MATAQSLALTAIQFCRRAARRFLGNRDKGQACKLVSEQKGGPVISKEVAFVP